MNGLERAILWITFCVMVTTSTILFGVLIHLIKSNNSLSEDNFEQSTYISELQANMTNLTRHIETMRHDNEVP